MSAYEEAKASVFNKLVTLNINPEESRNRALAYFAVIVEAADKEIATRDAELARLREALAEIREIWAGSDAFIPVTAPEAYAQHLCKQMYQAAIETLKSQ